MALILPGGAVGDLRGHILSSVFKNTRSGLSVAAPRKGTGKKAPTIFNMQQKLPFFSRKWREIGKPAQQAWDSYAANRPVINNLAQVTHLSGHMTYVLCNINLAMCGQPEITTPVVLQNITPTLITSVVADTQTGLITIVTDPLNQGNTSIILSASPPYSPGITKRPRVMKALGVLPGNQASPGDISALYETMFGEGWINNIGAKIRLMFTCIDNASGIKINEFAKTAIIQSIVPPVLSAWTVYLDNPIPGLTPGDSIANLDTGDSQVITAVDNSVNPNVTLTDFSGLWIPGNAIAFSSIGGAFAVLGVEPMPLSPWWYVQMTLPFASGIFHDDFLLNLSTNNAGKIYMSNGLFSEIKIEAMLGPVLIGDAIRNNTTNEQQTILSIVANG